MHMGTIHIAATAILLTATAGAAYAGIAKGTTGKALKYLSGVLLGINMAQLTFYAGLATEQAAVCSILTAIAMYATYWSAKKWLGCMRTTAAKQP